MTEGRFTVVRDTREKTGKGWLFHEDSYIEGTKIKKLDTGDYSILGLEKAVSIERKGRVVEYSGNLIKNYERFRREMDRLSHFAWPFVVLEFSYEDLKKGVRYSKVSGKFLARRHHELAEMYPTIKFIFAGKRKGKVTAHALLCKVWEEYHA